MTKSSPQPIYLKDYQAPDFLIERTNLEFELGEELTIVKSNLTMLANPNKVKTTKDLILNGEALQLKSVKINDKTLSSSDYKVTEDSLILFDVPESFNLEIVTEIKPQENTALTGLYKSSGNFCTQCEAEGFRRITYYLDRPDVMSRFTTTIIADETKYPILLSNGNLIEAGKKDKGRHWAKWEDPFKKPSYLFALVAGDLECVEDFFVTQSGRQVTLRIFVEKGNKDKCHHSMEAVKKAMRWDEERFGREYDLDIYMIVAVSDFNMGAMENKGLNIFNTKYILAKPETATDLDYLHVESVIAHEYCHNWSGNRITCRDWFQLSLKEGFTIFRDQTFTADTTSATVSRIQDVNDLRLSQFPEDSGPLAHPVRPESYIEINNFYTSTIYNKGAEVIRMMQTILGDKMFREATDLYFKRHDGQAVTIEDFVKAMEDVSKMDLTQFRLWYAQAGTPVLTVQDEYDEAKKTYTLTIKQTIPPTPEQPDKKPMHIPIKMGLISSKGKNLQSKLLELKKEEETFVFHEVQEKPVPSLLRHFSAPAKIQYDYTDEMLQLLFKYDEDLFNRWESGQKYSINLILRLVDSYNQNKKIIIPDEFIDAFLYAIQTMQEDKLLLVEMLTLPSEKYLAEQMAIVDVDAIHETREFVIRELAKQLKNLFISVYNKNNSKKAYEFSLPEVGKRQLKNLCLNFLMVLNDPEIHELALAQFERALTSNMTDTIGALRYLTNIEGHQREAALDQFYFYWKKDALVMDKWFSLQAISKLPDTLSQVKKLAHHPAFDIKNPNKVYSLVGAFCGHNQVRFHAQTGEGYNFLTDMVLKLDALNPQIAARMVTPLTGWKRYNSGRQDLMKKQLEHILQHKNLSNDVYELVSKSL